MIIKGTSGVRLALLLWLTSAVGMGQDLRIAGVALDPSGGAIANALVELTGPHGLQCTQTDDQGTFVLDGLEPSQYLLGVSAPNFSPCVQELSVQASQTDIVCELGLAVQTESVEVVAADPAASSTDPADNAGRVEIASETLQLLPALDGDIVGALQGLLDGGSFGSDGGGLVVDGMETADLGVSPSAIQEIRINKDPYSAEFSRPGNGRIEVITNSGSSRIARMHQPFW